MSFDCFYVVDRGRIAKIVEYTKTWNMAKSYLSLDGVCARVCVCVFNVGLNGKQQTAYKWLKIKQHQTKAVVSIHAAGRRRKRKQYAHPHTTHTTTKSTEPRSCCVVAKALEKRWQHNIKCAQDKKVHITNIFSPKKYPFVIFSRVFVRLDTFRCWCHSVLFLSLFPSRQPTFSVWHGVFDVVFVSSLHI